jgi:hypothetical protein
MWSAGEHFEAVSSCPYHLRGCALQGTIYLQVPRGRVSVFVNVCDSVCESVFHFVCDSACVCVCVCEKMIICDAKFMHRSC